MNKLTVTTASLALAAFAFTGVAVPTNADAALKYCDGPQVNWRLSLWGKRRAFTEGMEYVVKRVSEQTCGKFNIKLFYGEQLSKSKENLDSISVGAIEAGTFCAAYHPGKNAPLNVLDLPFLPLADFDVMRVVHDKIYAHPASKKALDKWKAGARNPSHQVLVVAALKKLETRKRVPKRKRYPQGRSGRTS